MSTLLGTTPGEVVPASEKATQTLLDRCDRAASVAQMFPGRKQGVDDFVASPTVRAARAAQEAAATKAQLQTEQDARFDRLPKPIQRAAAEKGITAQLDMLEVAGRLHRASDMMGGERVQCFASDIGRALDMPSQTVTGHISQAVALGLIQRTAHTLGGGTFKRAL